MVLFSSSGTVEPERISNFLSRQASLTKPHRRHLYRKVGIARKKRVLDVGCGTGEITEEIAALVAGEVIGVDVSRKLIDYAREKRGFAKYQVADCANLPFGDSSFDLVTCNFFLMWVREPIRAVSEMARVLEPSCQILICSEPDYGGRIEYPPHQEFSGALLRSLEKQGADPQMGRKLCQITHSLGLATEVGVSATPLYGKRLEKEFLANADMFLEDMEAVTSREKAGCIIKDELAQVMEGKLVLLPIFWALARKEG